MAKRRPWTTRRIQRLLIAHMPHLMYHDQAAVLRTAYRLSVADRFTNGFSMEAACRYAAAPTVEPHEATIRAALKQDWFS